MHANSIQHQQPRRQYGRSLQQISSRAWLEVSFRHFRFSTKHEITSEKRILGSRKKAQVVLSHRVKNVLAPMALTLLLEPRWGDCTVQDPADLYTSRAECLVMIVIICISSNGSLLRAVRLCVCVCVCVKSTESTGSILSADLSLADTSHALFDHITQLLQQRRDTIAVSLLRL